jgi:two-component system chemotaxis response regulator CheY
MRRVEREVLSELNGVEVIEADDGVSAIYKMRDIDFQVDLILADWVMPRMDGLSLVRRLKSNPALHRIPILMVTSCSDEARMRQAWSAGVDGYLLKPFTKEIFLQALFALTAEAHPHGEVPEEDEDDAKGEGDGKSFLYELPPEMRSRIVDMSAILDVPRGETVLKQGETLTYFYFVVEGNVEEHQPPAGGVGEAVRRFGPGECFGVTELMAGDPIRSDFLTTAPSRLGRLPQEVFEGMLEKFPKISITLSRCLASKARQFDVRGDDESDLSGRLEILDLPTLIQAISLRQKTCVIELPDLAAEIAFVSGRVVSVQKPDGKGEQAFHEIMAMNPTNFKLVVKSLAGEWNIHSSTTNLLLESAKYMDERAASAERKAGSEAAPEPAPEKA